MGIADRVVSSLKRTFFKTIFSFTHGHPYLYIYIYIYSDIESERKREREKDGERGCLAEKILANKIIVLFEKNIV